MDANFALGIAFTLGIVGICTAWFYWCGYAERTRQVRPFAKRTFRYAGCGLVLGAAYLSADFGSPPMGLVAFTVCCGLLVYVSGWALVISDDQSLVLINLTGRALLLAGPELAPFYSLPGPQEPTSELPPVFPRTCYVVTPYLGQLGARAGRTDMYTVDRSTAEDLGETGLLVRRLVRLAPDPSGAAMPAD